MSGYVCAFRGRRDDYQVPLALAESGRLDQFITDAYATAGMRSISSALGMFTSSRLGEKLARRWMPGIPEDKVKCLWGTTLVEHIRHRIGFSPVATFAELDSRFSQAAGSRANQSGADLFLYSPYAWEAFTAKYAARTPRKILFQFHPHPQFENELLTADVNHFPEVRKSFSEATGYELPERLRRRSQDAWRYADLIFCASSFTRRTLILAGADGARCAVVPYGVDLPPLAAETPIPSRNESFRALFVGNGVQRKGLHHLLYAWQRAKLPPDSQLTLVCRYLDPGLEELIARTPRARLFRGISKEQLSSLYCGSTLFVMPSLTEGFGQVYLEAMSHGCPVLGTQNTALPDIGTEADGVFLVEGANVDDLTDKIQRLSGELITDPSVRTRTKKRAELFSWARFREEINRSI